LNTASVGPGLNLVPDASMTDGLLRVILVESSVAAAPALLALLAGRLGSLEGVDTQTGKRIAVDWDGFRLHVDRYIYPRKADRPSLEMAESKNNPIQVEILRKAITIWFPRRGDDH
jgi:diacylglycerol kinase family enzyme